MKSIVKGWICGAVSVSLCFGVVSLAQGQWKSIDVLENGMNIVVDGKKMETPNFLYNDTTYVPLRAVSEGLGMKVGYENESSTATIHNELKDKLNNIFMMLLYGEIISERCDYLISFADSVYEQLDAIDMETDDLDTWLEYHKSLYDDAAEGFDEEFNNAPLVYGTPIGLDAEKIKGIQEEITETAKVSFTCGDNIKQYKKTGDSQYAIKALELANEVSERAKECRSDIDYINLLCIGMLEQK